MTTARRGRLRLRLAAWARPSWADRVALAVAALALAASLFSPAVPMRQSLFDHLVILDVTQSMNVPDRVLDGRPASRLAFAKRQVRDALLRLPCGSLIGLGLFTEHRSFLLLAPVDVCENLAELRASLDHIDNRMAWMGGSEVAKGLHAGIGIARQLPDAPSLVFVTDGHEAPPLSPRHRPPFPGTPGEVKGLVVGVGDLRPSPIPKTDPLGRPLGTWAADEVMQTDRRSLGRGASVGREAMVDDDAAAAPALGATPGGEHLSSLREAYLQRLAGETGLAYHRLEDPAAFAAALTAPALARPVTARRELAGPLAAFALLVLLLRHAGAATASWYRRVPEAGRRPGPGPAAGRSAAQHLQ